MKKIIKRIVDRIRFSYPIMIEESLTKILEEELPDFQRIDEERLLDCFGSLFTSFVRQHLSNSIQEYNSTLPPALVPLPKEMPKWFHNGISYHDLWSMVCLNYGTPEPKPNLPSVEELAKEMLNVWSVNTFNEVAEYVIDKYSLHPREDVDKLKQELEDERIKHAACGTAALGYFTGCHEKYLSASLQDVINLRLKYEGLLNHPREWWQDLKEGDKFMYAGEAYEYYGYEVNIRGEVTLWGKSTWKFRLSGCTPYTPPSAQDIIAKHNLSEEEVKILREGKCT